MRNTLSPWRICRLSRISSSRITSGRKTWVPTEGVDARWATFILPKFGTLKRYFARGNSRPVGPHSNSRAVARAPRRPSSWCEFKKDIISATWKLIRRETRERPTKEFVEDVGVIIDSQGDALEQVRQLAQQAAGGPASQQSVNVITKHMLDAITSLKMSREDEDPSYLTDSVSAEQNAYQELLKAACSRASGDARQSSVRSRAEAVVRAVANSSSEQLQLQNNENRYETQRLAQSQNDQAQSRESRQVMNRLRELARRQADLNQQLKELMSALEAAETEEQRAEIERQLKRLREAQQENLARQ